MPTFTMELWRVISLKPDAVAEDEFLGLSDYPIYDDNYRNGLNEKIKNHFMYQEIGHETVEQFTFSMKRKMAEIMPLYNQLYESTKLTFDPLSTIDISSTSTGSQTQNSTGTSTNSTTGDVGSTAKTVSSAFPQVGLSPNKDYATSGSDSVSNSKTTGGGTEASSAENTATLDNTSSTKGYQGNASQLLMQYRAAMLNVDMLVIAELDELFMAVWNNGDEYTYRRFE